MQNYLLFYLLLFGLFTFAWLYFCLARYRKKQRLWFLGSASLPQGSRSILGFSFRVICLLGAWIFLLVSIMQQEETCAGGEVITVFQLDNVEFVVDVSASMNCLDTTAGSSRLARAKEIISQVVRKMSGVNISLRAFAADSVQIVPPTEDYVYFQTALEDLANDDVPVAGTDFTLLASDLQKEGLLAAKRLTILLSDGEDTSFLDLSASQKKETEQNILQKISSIDSSWIVVAIGSEKGAAIPNLQYQGVPAVSRMHPLFLEAIAKSGKGLFYNDNNTTLAAMTDAIFLDVALKGRPQKVVSAKTRDVLFPVIAAFFLIILSCIIPQVRLVAAACLFSFSSMEAASFVQDSIDQSLSLSQAGRGDLAIRKLQELLAMPLSSQERNIVLYDMATLLAKDGRYTEALDYFRQVEAGNSPVLFESLAYNGALCCIKIALALHDSEEIAKYMGEAKEFASRSQAAGPQFQEAFTDLEKKKNFLSVKERLDKSLPKEMLELFISYLERSIARISETQSFESFWSQNEDLFDAYSEKISDKEIQSVCADIKKKAEKNDAAGVQAAMKKLINLLQKKAQEENNQEALPQKKRSEFKNSVSQNSSIQRLQEMLQDDMSLQKESEEKTAVQTEGKYPW